ncbi:uncharacterized protein LOC129960926 [Argiope bruennichi]|uniref:uncharacterized protein LOC129960926 n=1 Tax=Argiope bruennichi TaxID=94029 RepID=UPI002493D119|nr:uncharacterized protein LOC129960926 [Argiope bruennichi]
MPRKRKSTLSKRSNKARAMKVARRPVCKFSEHLRTSNPLQLWDKYKDAFSKDIVHRLDGTHNNLIINEALVLIEDKIISISGKCLTDFGLTSAQRRDELSSEVVKEQNYDTVVLEAQVNEMIPRLFSEQRQIYKTILNRVNNGEEGLFFLDAPEDTGKTFVLNLLLAQLRKDRNIALALSSSGIAATLLNSGYIEHSVFKLQLNLANEYTPKCNITKNNDRGVLLQQYIT